MSESDISSSVKNGILFLEDPFDQVCAVYRLLINVEYCFRILTLLTGEGCSACGKFFCGSGSYVRGKCLKIGKK